MTNVADEVMRLFAEKGSDAYFGENVSNLEHSLQTAALARQAGVADTLIAAALLHDIGHLLHGFGEDIADRGIDARHEVAGEAWLRTRFEPATTEPVRMHVDAKRYLCRIDYEYAQNLSPSSLLSLKLQGGPFSDAEMREFESRPWHAEALLLRRWDDAAKIPGLNVPGLDTYRDILGRAALIKTPDQRFSV